MPSPLTSDELHILAQAIISTVEGKGYPQQLGMMRLVEEGYLQPICCGNVKATSKAFEAVADVPTGCLLPKYVPVDKW